MDLTLNRNVQAVAEDMERPGEAGGSASRAQASEAEWSHEEATVTWRAVSGGQNLEAGGVGASLTAEEAGTRQTQSINQALVEQLISLLR